VGCNKQESRTVGRAQDTVVTSRQTQDTMVVTHDTTVKVDTTMKRGDRTTHADTVKRAHGASRPSGTDTSGRSQ
jgi:hypothetical protein